MATAIQKIAALAAPRDIPFNKLALSQSNVRRVNAGVSIEELADDIARRGLLHNLNVRPVLDGEGQETGSYEVPAGGRRFRALEHLVKTKRLAKNAPVPCNVRDANSPISAEEDSLAENVRREPLHPLDQFRAFQRQVDGGATVEEVATRFFVTPTLVKQRLRLASVAPDLLEAYAADAMTLEQLMAFTVATDHDRQRQVWETLQRSGLRQPYYIRQALTEAAIHASDRRAVFVGMEAYEAAGGSVTRDLFEQDRGGWVTDVALLDRLATEKLADAARSVADEGWGWVDAALDYPYGHTSGLRRIHGRQPEVTDADEAAHDARVDELERLLAEYEGDENTPDEVVARVEELEAAIEAFTHPALIYDPEEVARGGVFVTLRNDGSLNVQRGYVRPGDEPKTERDTADGATGVEPVAVGGPEQPSNVVTIGGAAFDPAAEPDEDDGLKPLSERLVTELTSHRTVALRDALAWEPDTAHLTVLHALALPVFYHYAQDSCLEISARSSSLTTQAPGLGESPSCKAIDARTQYWAEQLPKQADELWDALVALGTNERHTLFAHCASLTVNVTQEPFNRRPRALAHGDVLARAVGLDMAVAGWRPTVDGYLGRVPKARILEAVREAKGELAAQLIDHLKKGDMAKEAERLLTDTGWVPEPLRVEAIDPEPVGDAGEAEALPDFLADDQEAETDETDPDDEPLAVAAE